MVDVINDRDTLLLGSPERGSNPLSSEILFQLSANGFRVDNNNNVGAPATITITAILIDLLGTVTFTATGATLTDNGDNTATLSYQNMSSDSAIVTATLTSNGQVFTRSVQIDKISDGRQGSDGADGRKYATVYMYQFAPSQPAKPTGTSGYTWATGVNSTYGASDGWSTTVPTNPGGPNTKLYVASINISAEGAAVSTIVNYSTSSVAAWTQNGANGVSGIQSATAIVYQWAASIPTGPVGTATYTWATGAYTAPSGWALVPPNPPSQGISLWAARVNLTDSAQNSTASFNWGTASIYIAGSSGANGAAGPSGASFVIAYAASSSITANGTPAATTGKTSVPAPNSGGIVGTYTKTVPTLADGQRMFQVDGIYDPTTNLVTWSVPYWSVFKVGSLSAVSVNTGNLTITDRIGDGAGNWYVDSNGKMFARDFEFRKTDGTLIMGTGGLAAGALPSGVNNSEIVVGGRNLFPDGDFERGIHSLFGAGYSGVQISNTEGSISGTKSLFIYGTGTDMYVYLGTRISVTPGREYRISFYSKSATVGVITSSSSYLKLWNSSGAADNWPALPMSGLGSGVWQRQVVAWTCPPGVTQIEPRFGILTNGAYSWLAIDCVQIEEGNAATQWTPALEDIAADAQAKANAAADVAYVGAIADANGKLAVKLNKGDDVLGGILSVNTVNAPAGFRTGTLTWNTAGDYTGGYGTAMTPKGLIGYSTSGLRTFMVNGQTGDVQIRGAIMGGAYTGAWWPVAGQAGFYLGPEGLLMGNANDGRYVQITAGGDLYSATMNIINGQVSIKSADSGQRTEIDKNGTRVYASNGQLLVRLGVW